MKKVGFIDYYLNEWHADNYPEFLEKETNGEYKVCYGYGEIDCPFGMTNKDWCEKYGVELCSTIEEVIEKSDVLVVLAPDNPETHERLCEKPLASGKRTYVDKTFAPDKATAERIFANADAHGTPCYTTSALRFAANYQALKKEGIKNIHSFGPGNTEIYSIHQIEPIVLMMGTDAKTVTFTGDCKYPSFVIEFEGDRFAEFTMKGDAFDMQIAYEDGEFQHIQADGNFWDSFTTELVDFFENGTVKVDHKETMAVMAIREAAIKSLEKPWTKIDV